VLEIDEHVPARARLGGNRVGPAGDVAGRVAFVAQPEVGVVGGDPDGGGHLLAVGDAQREVPFRQPFEDLVVEPRLVTELEGGGRLRRQLVEKRVEERHVLLRIRRQLEQQRPQLVAERAGHAAKRLDELAAVLQPAVVGDPPRCLQRELVGRRRLRRPPADELLVRHAVEGVVDLNRRKARGVVRQHLRRRKIGGIEVALPFGVVVA
jgi:hypothetical protein